jgi:acid phosphatase
MTDRNHVAGIVLGDVVPKNLVGTNDSAYYNHYSQISTVEAK